MLKMDEVETENLYSIPRAKAIIERNLIERALVKHRGNRTKAAIDLEISHRALLYKMHTYGIQMRTTTPMIEYDEYAENSERKRYRTADGYIVVNGSSHRYAGKRNMVPEHVAIMEDLIGRRLHAGECVHHIDGNKSNNDISNLMLMTLYEHAKLHSLQRIHGNGD